MKSERERIKERQQKKKSSDGFTATTAVAAGLDPSFIKLLFRETTLPNASRDDSASPNKLRSVIDGAFDGSSIIATPSRFLNFAFQLYLPSWRWSYNLNSVVAGSTWIRVNAASAIDNSTLTLHIVVILFYVKFFIAPAAVAAPIDATCDSRLKHINSKRTVVLQQQLLLLAAKSIISIYNIITRWIYTNSCVSIKLQYHTARIIVLYVQD